MRGWVWVWVLLMMMKCWPLLEDGAARQAHEDMHCGVEIVHGFGMCSIFEIWKRGEMEPRDERSSHGDRVYSSEYVIDKDL